MLSLVERAMGRKAKRIKAGIDLPPPYERAVTEDMARWRSSRSAMIQRALRAYFGPLLAIDEVSVPASKAMAAVPRVTDDATTSSEMTVPKVTGDATIWSEMSAISPAHLSASAPRPTGQNTTATGIRVKVVPSVGSSRRVKAIPTVRSTVGSTTTSGTDTPKSILTGPFSRESEEEFSQRAALPWMLEAHQDQVEIEGPEDSPGDSSPMTARRMTHGSVGRRYMFPHGSIVRVRRRDGTAYLARVVR